MEFVGSILILIGIYTILATSFNLIIGFGGLISIAHPIFFALGGLRLGARSTCTSACRSRSAIAFGTAVRRW